MYVYDENETREQSVHVAITLGNEAMRTPQDVARALRDVAAKLNRDGATGYYETILDGNGNDVGRWKMGPVRP